MSLHRRFDESKVNRDEDGKFGSGSGGGSSAITLPSTSDRGGDTIKAGTRIQIVKGKHKGKTATVTAVVEQYPIASITVDVDGKGPAKVYARDVRKDEGAETKSALSANVSRRSSGETLRTEDEFGFPQAADSSKIDLDDGSTLTLHKGSDGHIHVGGGTNASALTVEEIEEIKSSVIEAHDDGWDVGESDELADMDGGAFARVTKTGKNQYRVDIDGRTSFTVTAKQARQMESDAQRIRLAQRVNTPYGPADVYLTPDGKLGMRTTDAYGEPVGVELSPAQASKLGNAVNATYEGSDPNGELYNEDGSRIDQVDVPIGKGRSVHVEQQGTTPGGNGGPKGDLILEADDGSWAITVDPKSYDAFTTALYDVTDAL